MKRKVLIAALMMSTSIGAGVLAAKRPAHAQATQAVNYSVPSGSLTQALAMFGRQSGLQVTYLAALTSGRASPGFTGRGSREQALAAILRGSGLTYSFPNATTVAIAAPAANAQAPGGGSIVLDTIDVSAGRGSVADAPYRTPGSVSYISEETIQRFRGNSAGDMFKGTPGVISGSNRNGASIDVNIRGLQGMNRVATTIDGSEQSTSSYRGYYGVDSRTYVDPDLISSVTITKGPTNGSPGAIGGTLAMETLNVGDILRPGENVGVRLRGGIASNGVVPIIGATTSRNQQPSFFDLENGSASAAFAMTQQNVDVVAAFVRRQSGNYFAGSHGALAVPNAFGAFQQLSRFKYGQEVFNTSEDVTSALLKATLRLAEGHELKLGYLHYGNVFGEVTPLIVDPSFTPRQIPLAKIAVDQLTARYSWKPLDNNLIDFKSNSWMSSVNEDSVYSVFTNSTYIKIRTRSYGVDASNTSRFNIESMPFTLRYGGAMKMEDSEPRRPIQTTNANPTGAAPVDGTRQIGTLFVNGKWEPIRWLALDAGVEYLTFGTDYRGTAIYRYTGPPYTGYTGAGFSPNFGVTVTPLEGWQLFGRFTSGIRPPSLRETSWTRFEQRFNPDLVAEKARNWEVGTNFLKNGLFLPDDKARLKFAYFDNVTDDYIGRRAINFSTLTLFNYDKVEFKGFELSGGYDAKRVFVDFAFNYYTDFKACPTALVCVGHTLQADYLANQIPPDFTFAATLGARFLDEKLTLGGRVTYTGQRLAPLVPDPTYFFITKAWAPYTLVDLFAQWKVNDNITLDVNVDNLLDRYYVDALNNTDMPAPGRVVRASLTGRFGDTVPNFGSSLMAAGAPNWSGAYLGAHAGHGFGSVAGTTTAGNGTPGGIPATESADQSLENILGGVQAGFNVHVASGLVLGLEADFTWTGLADQREAIATESATLTNRKQRQARTDYEFNWLSTVRGRVGVAFDRVLVYGTGGIAFMNETEERSQFRSNNSSFIVPTGDTTDFWFSERVSAIRTGWVIGAGGEYAFAGHWSLKGEYLYARFREKDFHFRNGRAGVTGTYTDWLSWPFVDVPGTSTVVNGRKATNKADIQLLKLGVNYRF